MSYPRIVCEQRTETLSDTFRYFLCSFVLLFSEPLRRDPICRDRQKWRHIAKGYVAPKKFYPRFLYDFYPELYKRKVGPDGETIFDGIPENDATYRDLCA